MASIDHLDFPTPDLSLWYEGPNHDPEIAPLWQRVLLVLGSAAVLWGMLLGMVALLIHAVG